MSKPETTSDLLSAINCTRSAAAQVGAGCSCLTAACAGQPREVYRERETVSFLGGRFFIGDSRRKTTAAMLPLPHAPRTHNCVRPAGGMSNPTSPERRRPPLQFIVQCTIYDAVHNEVALARNVGNTRVNGTLRISPVFV